MNHLQSQQRWALREFREYVLMRGMNYDFDVIMLLRAWLGQQ